MAEERVAFDGVRLMISTEHLDDSSFERIASGASVETTFDIAELHDLSSGGAFKVSSRGAFSFAEEGSNELVGSVGFDSNEVEAEIDGETAATVHTTFHHDKRTRLQSDCSGTRLSQTRTALSTCASMASQAQQVAQSGSAAKMTEYFKSSSTSTRNTVAAVFSRIRSECASTTGGVSNWYCTDVYGYCSG